MEDTDIIELYNKRDENAIKETQKKYGRYCTAIALNLLGIPEDAQECVNDTYMTAWNRIPPLFPVCLRVFLGRVTRNIAVGRYRKAHTEKRDRCLELTLSELEECMPSDASVEKALETKILSEYINEWLDGLEEYDRMLFVRRYWYGDKAKQLAARTGLSESGMSRRLSRLRESLRKFLTERGTQI